MSDDLIPYPGFERIALEPLAFERHLAVVLDRLDDAEREVRGRWLLFGVYAMMDSFDPAAEAARKAWRLGCTLLP